MIYRILSIAVLMGFVLLMPAKLQGAQASNNDGDVGVTSQAFPVEARSWGGKVRAGPGMDFAHILSLKEGDAITLLENTGVMMNGYPWFRIAFLESREGFQWGGILCFTTTPVEGVYRSCSTNFSRPLSTGDDDNQAGNDMNTAQAPQNNQINYIELPLHDGAKTKAFYNQVFGWTFTDWGPDYISFEGAGIDGGFNAEALVSNSGTGALVILYADDLEKTLANVEKAGGKIVRPIFDFPGGKRFHFVDPNGNHLAVWSQ